MKKIIIPIAIATLAMGLSGCSLSNVNPMEVKAEDKKELITYDFGYSVELSYEEKLKAQIKIDNNENIAVPLNVIGSDLFIVKLINNETNAVLNTQKISLKNRTEINKMEQVVNDVYFDVPATGEYKVVVEHQLRNTETANYDKISDSVSKRIDVEVTEITEYHPIKYAKKRNLQYEYKDAAGKKVYSHYDYYDQNKIQGLSNKYGVIVFADTEEGLKTERINDYVGDVNSLEFIDESNMELLIPKYPEVGQTWKNGEKEFTVMGVNSSTKTAYAKFDHLVRIQVKQGKQGKQIKDYYFDEEFGLVKIVQKRSNSEKDVTELQLVDIEVQ